MEKKKLKKKLNNLIHSDLEKKRRNPREDFSLNNCNFHRNFPIPEKFSGKSDFI